MIVVNGTPALAEIHKMTRTIPVVSMAAIDPVGLGFIESLARPGGNITGFGSFEVALMSKWLRASEGNGAVAQPWHCRAQSIQHALTYPRLIE